jgi:fatty acid desaturase
MEPKVTTTEKLFEQATKYIKTSLEILELKLIAKSADVFSILTSIIALFVVVTLFCFILSIGLSFYIGDYLGKDYYGFFIVALFYLILLLIMYFNKSRLKSPIKNMIISELLKKNR